MKIIKPYIILERRDQINGEEILANLERYGRKCYQSEAIVTWEKISD